MYGKRGQTTFKTKEYLDYQNEIRDELMGDFTEWPFGDGLVQFTIEAGLSNRGADIDNVLKPLLDTYQGIYEDFNDNKVYHLDVTKVIVSKGDEYLTVTIEEYNEDNNKKDNPDS